MKTAGWMLLGALAFACAGPAQQTWQEAEGGQVSAPAGSASSRATSTNPPPGAAVRGATSPSTPPGPPAAAPSPAAALLAQGSSFTANPADVARAKKAMEKGVGHYRRGEYDAAEESLKEAITLYPFLPEANLALGKILLIRGAAKRDLALLASARLMFEMAKALDPNLRESSVLLELFAPAPE